MMFYFRSTLTGQCYKAEFFPAFASYEPISEATYLAWCRSVGIPA